MITLAAISSFTSGWISPVRTVRPRRAEKSVAAAAENHPRTPSCADATRSKIAVASAPRPSTFASSTSTALVRSAAAITGRCSSGSAPGGN